MNCEKVKSKWVFPIMGCIIIIVAVFLVSCGEKKEKSTVPVVKPVKTMILESAGSASILTYPGKVKATQEADLAFQVSGRLIKLPIKKGQVVKKGDLIARLDPHDFQSKLAAEKARLLQAKGEFKRAEDLYARDAISITEYDRKKRTYKVVEANVKIAAKSLDDTYLRAPFAGNIAKKYVENFQDVLAKQHIVSLQDVSSIEIVFNIPEKIMATVKEQDVDKLTAKFDFLPDREFDVTVKEYGTEADSQTQTYPITFIMQALKEAEILPGMTATITVYMKASDGAQASQFEIPVGAVFADEQNKQYIWIVDQTSMKVSKREIKVRGLTGGNIQVLDGLKPGEMIVTAGVNYLHEGMKIRPIKGKIGG